MTQLAEPVPLNIRNAPTRLMQQLDYGKGYMYAHDYKDKLTAMSEDEQLALLATDGMLVKRPLLVGEDFVLTGFRATEWEARLG